MFIRGSLARARKFFEKRSPAVRKPRFHFVEDYRRHVNNLLASYPLDQAMNLAVGGHYQSFGRLERELLILCGLQPDHYLIDIGCGSGRLALSLRNYLRGRYLGTDVVPELLDYARSHCPSHWRFELVEGLSIPENNSVADIVCLFSVFTHLLHEESFCYLNEAVRVLKPGGKIVFSFLDITQPSNWSQFEAMVRDGGVQPVLNIYLGYDMIRAWCQHLNLELERLQPSDIPWVTLPETINDDDGGIPAGLATLGQSVAVLKKPLLG